MWFRNLLVYRIDAAAKLDPAAIEQDLSRHALQACGSFEMESRGWVCPREEGRYLHALERQWLVHHGSNQRLLPAAVVNQTVKERAEGLAGRQGRPAGRKQVREIRERVLEELMPKAFTRRRVTRAWIDPVNRWMVTDTASAKKADETLESLLRAHPGFAAKRLDTERSPAAAMTQWLADGEVPGPFTIDRDLELKAADDHGATVRYVRHALEGREIREHIKAGKTATQLGLTWRERVSFVLTAELQIKRISLLDIVKEEARAGTQEADERFDADFAIMAGELGAMLADLARALGGAR